ncbi:DUF1289 domain-containing protein [Stutzerimonas degradans]|uniref:DUF1289 domain-containing protein n=1 Tax=Stutzerimonas degradans TaxID=2968968 RepID=UPI0028D732DB|nr:DUF1289 domain-containing protein [Stutzerimonas degradans]
MGGKVDNPCVDLCKLKDDICVSCGRSRDEIKRWKKLKNKERKVVRQQAAERLANLGKANKRKP